MNIFTFKYIYIYTNLYFSVYSYIFSYMIIYITIIYHNDQLIIKGNKIQSVDWCRLRWICRKHSAWCLRNPKDFPSFNGGLRRCTLTWDHQWLGGRLRDTWSSKFSCSPKLVDSIAKIFSILWSFGHLILELSYHMWISFTDCKQHLCHPRWNCSMVLLLVC